LRARVLIVSAASRTAGFLCKNHQPALIERHYRYAGREAILGAKLLERKPILALEPEKKKKKNSFFQKRS